MRVLILTLAVTLISTAVVANSKAPAITPVMLNSALKVNAKVIRLGDLFTNTGDQSSVAVAYAPEPGKRASFDARWLYRVARAYRLEWRPINDRVRAVVTRISQVIGRDEIKAALRDALVDEGIGPNADIEFSNRLMKLHVPGDSLVGVAVDDIDFDPRSRRFSAVISAPAGSPDARQFQIRGRIYKTVEVPVLVRRILAGEVIKASDLKWIKVRARRMQPNTVIAEADIVGMTPRRGLRPGYPVLLSSIHRPIIVAKGSLVTMFLQAPKMILTAQGKALENGSDGDVIRISNTQSKKVVEAEIIGHGKVAVRATAQLAMN